MKKVLLWGMGDCFRMHLCTVKYYEALNHFKVIGITSDNSAFVEFCGYKYISKSQISDIEFDYVVVMAGRDIHKEILKEAISIGIAKECIFNYRVLLHHGFDINKYTSIKKNPPSIFTNNCWGGFTYHSLDLEFTSPFINMFELPEDYLKLLKNPKQYMNEDLQLITTKYEENLNINYPIVKCGDITLYFNHYDSFENAKACWERRKKRINWDNLLIMMLTEDRALANEFINLPYEKKVCFVPFESAEKSLIHVAFREANAMKKIPFWQIVNGMATGRYPYYDVFELIGNAEFSPIVKVID